VWATEPLKIVKNKLAPPFREAEFDILYGQGISREGDLLDLGAAQNVLEKSGSWFSYKGERIGQGRENARQFLKDNPDVSGKIESELRKMLGLNRVEPRHPSQRRKRLQKGRCSPPHAAGSFVRFSMNRGWLASG